ncbi:hypothetical protein KEM55_002742 [Ascosphaera atra]|nr:hypothetical protein KEM55_002742 [Ascosphaera atra]
MAHVDTLDIVVLATLLVATFAYFTKGSLWAKRVDPYVMSCGSVDNVSSSPVAGTRDVLKNMNESYKNCVIFYGSQTGTAEDYARRLAKEGSQRFGLKTMVADLEEYDYANLDQWPEDKLAFFVLATYGEGEPTDNAVDFYAFISSEEVTFGSGASANDEPLRNLKYVAFGLGNNTYEHYNHMIRNTNQALHRLGAKRIGPCGEGDDGAGTMEEDFLAWKEAMWHAVMKELGLEEREAVYEPVFNIEEEEVEREDTEHIYLGEPTENHLGVAPLGPYSASNPYIATVTASRELFSVKGRNCVHMEIDITGSGLTYQTGDHLAVWPHNAGIEVDRFLRVFGLGAKEKRRRIITAKSFDVTAKVPFPSPTTYETVVRYYMEICGPASRQFLASLVPFAPTAAARLEMKRLAGHKEYFQNKVTSRCLNLAQTLQSVCSEPFSAVPFSLLVEGIHRIQPRYYSISSSSIAQPNCVSITAVVESIRIPGSDDVLKGVATNYLLALKDKQEAAAAAAAAAKSGSTAADSKNVLNAATDVPLNINKLRYVLEGPRNKLAPFKLLVHVRHSSFKLPSDPKRPIIMVGPGTGVAPFRGFIQERVELKKRGEEIGIMLLFFGCRSVEEDFLYKEEWEVS